MVSVDGVKVILKKKKKVSDSEPESRKEGSRECRRGAPFPSRPLSGQNPSSSGERSAWTSHGVERSEAEAHGSGSRLAP